MSNDFQGMGADAKYGQVTDDERLWAMLAHLSIFVFGIFGPLIIWMIKKEESAFIEDQAKEALNFQLSVLLLNLILVVTCVGPMIVGVAAIVYGVIAGMEANKGIAFRYQYTYRFIK